MRRGYLIDMDGVIYRGGELIPGAQAFLQRLVREAIPFLFLTNNSQRTRHDVATKLARIGIPAEEEHVFTCAMATARHFDVSPGHVTPISSEKKDHHVYRIKLKYGHHKMAYCSIQKNGEIKRIKRED